MRLVYCVVWVNTVDIPMITALKCLGAGIIGLRTLSVAQGPASDGRKHITRPDLQKVNCYTAPSRR